MRPKKGEELYNKKTHFLSFYDAEDERLVAIFDSIREICLFKKLSPTSKNLNLIQVHLCLALKRPDCTTWLLNGKLMHVHLVEYNKEP